MSPNVTVCHNKCLCYNPVPALTHFFAWPQLQCYHRVLLYLQPYTCSRITRRSNPSLNLLGTFPYTPSTHKSIWSHTCQIFSLTVLRNYGMMYQLIIISSWLTHFEYNCARLVSLIYDNLCYMIRIMNYNSGLCLKRLRLSSFCVWKLNTTEVWNYFYCGRTSNRWQLSTWQLAVGTALSPSLSLCILFQCRV